MKTHDPYILFISFILLGLSVLPAGAQWTELRVGPSAALGSASPTTLCLDKSGNLYVAEVNDIVNTGTYVARWNGYYWSSIGACGYRFNASISSLLIGRYGEFYVGGEINWGSPPVIGIGSLYGDTTDWVDIGAPPCSDISTMCLDTANNLYAVGVFTNASGNYYVASSALGWGEVGGNNALKANNYIDALYGDPFGNVYAAGDFTDSMGKRYVAKWNGTRWSELGHGSGILGANSTIFAITGDSSGNIYAAGAFTDSSSKIYVAKWNGTSWSELGTGSAALNTIGNILTLAVDRSGNLYAAGSMTDSVAHSPFVAKWDGTSWSRVGQGNNSLNVSGAITAICIDSADHIFIGGDFDYVKEWNGNSWNPLGLINLSGSSVVTLMATNTDSMVYVAPIVDSSGYNSVFKWDGFSFSEVGTGANALRKSGNIETMCHDSSGNIYLAGELPDTSGSSAVFKWNGNSWSSIGSFGGSLAIQYNPYAVDIHQLCADSHGNIYAITYCSSPGIYGVGTVQMWNGVLWNDISPYNLNGGYFYTTADNHGNIYLMGSNSTLGRSDIEKWNGTSWTEIMTIPNGIEFYGMCMDTFGDLYISGLFSDSIGRHCNLAVRKPNGYVVYDSSGFNITAMTITPQNRLCLSSDSGYYEWGGTSWHFVQFEGYCYTADRAGVICGDYAGNIYLGTGGAGVSVNFGGSVDDTRTGSGCIAEYHDSYGVFIDTIGTYFDTTDTHTSVKQLGDNRIDIYPNPTNGALILQFNNGISGVVCISDIEG